MEQGPNSLRPRFSIVIPARDEEAFIGRCLEGIQKASLELKGKEVEIVVVLNRCTDRTEEIARSFGAMIVHDDSKNLARIRNHGARAATGEILVTIDADSVMSPNLLAAIDTRMESGRYIGGGVHIVPDRMSLGIALTGLLVAIVLLWQRVMVGVFFCRREDFLAVGGFREELSSVEDIDFAKRLRRFGKRHQKRFAYVFEGSIKTSCRKFDRFGDWYFLRHPFMTLALFKGKHQEYSDKVWYDFEH